MKSKTLISLKGAVISNPLRRLSAPVDFELREGEHIALVGPNGSGKSTLLEMIRGGFYLREGTLRHNLDDEPYKAIRTVEFDNAYSTSETQYYYQQRWQSFEREAAPLAGSLLEPASPDGSEEQSADVETDCQNDTPQSNLSWRQRLFDILNITPLLSKEIITLSSGELRRFSIARALLKRPQVLVMESPFIGLDPPTRKILSDLMDHLASSLGISFIMTLTSADQIPPVITHVYFMDNGRVSKKYSSEEARLAGQNLRIKEVLPDSRSVPSLLNAGRTCFHASVDSSLQVETRSGHLSFWIGSETDTGALLLPQLRETQRFDKVVEMRDINICFGERQLFRNLNWTVRSGEKWNVTGPNGSGKSTLLSLVNADNPRAYSLDITLFDRRRGTGESIWDIKRHIGFLSSEMHSSFITSEPVLEIVRSGLGDRFGGGELSGRMPGGELAEAQTDTDYRSTINYGSDLQQNSNNQTDSLQQHNTEDDYLLQWLRLFGAEHLAQRSYNTLSSGEQRYVLLIRAFVKDPDLLILDEPFQGLDPEKRHRAAAVIEEFCARSNKTLIFVTHYIEEIPGVVTDTLKL